MLCMYLAMIDEQVDKIRFEEIYYGYHKQMLVVANRVLCNMDDAEDAVQDALIRIARNMDAIRDREDWAVRGYVLTVAKNSALKVLAKNQRNSKAIDVLKVKPEKDEDVFDHVLNCLDYQLLLRSIQHLEPLYRQVLMLVYVQKQSLKEVADILGRKEETVRKQLYRGRKLLIEFCKKEGLNYDQD